MPGSPVQGVPTVSPSAAARAGGDATSADCVDLMVEARRRVREQFGVELEREVVLVGLELPT